MTNPELAVFVAALMHFIQIPGTWVVARVVDLPGSIGTLPALPRRIVMVLGLAVISVLVWLGTMLAVAAYSGELAASPTWSLSALFMGVFWGARLAAQTLLYGHLFYKVPNPWAPASHRALCAIFFTQAALYLTGASLLLLR